MSGSPPAIRTADPPAGAPSIERIRVAPHRVVGIEEFGRHPVGVGADGSR